MAQPFVDRLEGAFAVLVIDGRERRVARASLPPGAGEGTYLSSDLTSVDRAATEEAARSVAARRAALARDDDGGDVSL